MSGPLHLILEEAPSLPAVYPERRDSDHANRREELFRQLVETTKVIPWEADLGRRRFTFVGKQAVPRFGYALDEWLMPEFWTRHLHLEDQVSTPVKDLELAQTSREYELEYRMLARDGEVVWVHDYVHIVDDASGPRRLQGIWVDVTVARRTEEALRASQRRLQLHLENTPLGIIEWNSNLQVTAWNPAAERIFGYTAAEAIGRPIFFVGPPSLKLHVEQLGQQLLQRKKAHRSVVQNTVKGGRTIICEWYNTPLVDEQGFYLGVASVVQDITERIESDEQIRQSNEELERRVQARTAQLDAANKELEAFCYSVSHDLRAPLRAIDGFSKALLEDCLEQLDEGGRDHLRRICGATARMGELIDDLLDLSRVTRKEMRRERVLLSQLAEAITANLRQQQPERQADFLIEPDLTADGDSNLLQVVLENLLGNAWKYTSKHSHARIEFGALRKYGATIFFVRDDGAGFDPAFTGRLFQPFQRLHHYEDFEGHGIGLATVQRIVHRHGGEVWAEGAVEKGATFYFSL